VLTRTRRETERDWDKDLADDVRGECEEKYGKVLDLKVEKESEVRLLQTFLYTIQLTLKPTGRNLHQI
jgi:hypothetical protein